MMGILLDVLYLLFLTAASPILLWRMIRQGKYREGFAEKFRGLSPITPEGDAPVIWFHAVSVGEVNLLKPIIPILRDEHPNWRLVVSSTSMTGRRLAEKLFAGKIEWQTDPMGNGYVNIAKSKGQTDFFHLLLEHMNPQKLKTLHNEDGLRNFKQVLKKNVRHLGKVLNNKSLGVTLHRLIDKT